MIPTNKDSERFRWQGFDPDVHRVLFVDEFEGNLDVSVWKTAVAGETFSAEVKKEQSTRITMEMPMIFVCIVVLYLVRG